MGEAGSERLTELLATGAFPINLIDFFLP